MTSPSLERAVLVGGTGRSGTTIAGRVLNHHPDLALTTPRELRFLTGRGGLLDTLGPRLPGGEAYQRPDEAGPERFAERMRAGFYRWSKPSGVEGGLHRTVTQDTLDAALSQYLDEVDFDPITAARGLVFALIPSTVRGRTTCRWVDTTPTNAQRARALNGLLPQMRLVHMMRDGRDVAVSFAGKQFGPDNAFDALELWGNRMLRCFAEESELPPGVVVRVDLADWNAQDGLDSLRALCDAIGVVHDTALEAWFVENVTASAMHRGRWHAELSARDAATLDARYADWCQLLTDRFPQFALPQST